MCKKIFVTIFSVVCLCSLLAACGAGKTITGTLFDWNGVEGDLVSFVLSDSTGKRTCFVVTEDCEITSSSPEIDPADFCRGVCKSVLSVRVVCGEARENTCDSTGSDIPAYTARSIQLSPQGAF